MKPSELVSGALDLLVDESDWCRGQSSRYSLEHRKTQYCLLGSILHATDSSGWLTCWTGVQSQSLAAVREVIAEQYRDHEGGIGAWNDTHAFPEVRMILEKTLAALEEQGQ